MTTQARAWMGRRDGDYRRMGRDGSTACIMAIGLVFGALIVLGIGGVAVVGLVQTEYMKNEITVMQASIKTLTVPTKLTATEICVDNLIVHNVTAFPNSTVNFPPPPRCVRGLAGDHIGLASGPATPYVFNWTLDVVDSAPVACFEDSNTTLVPLDGHYTVGAFIRFYDLDPSIMGLVVSVLADGEEVCGTETADPASSTSTLGFSRLACSCQVELLQDTNVQVSVTTLPDAGAPHDFSLDAGSRMWLVLQ